MRNYNFPINLKAVFLAILGSGGILRLSQQTPVWQNIFIKDKQITKTEALLLSELRALQLLY